MRQETDKRGWEREIRAREPWIGLGTASCTCQRHRRPLSISMPLYNVNIFSLATGTTSVSTTAPGVRRHPDPASAQRPGTFSGEGPSKSRHKYFDFGSSTLRATGTGRQEQDSSEHGKVKIVFNVLARNKVALPAGVCRLWLGPYMA